MLWVAMADIGSKIFRLVGFLTRRQRSGSTEAVVS